VGGWPGNGVLRNGEAGRIVVPTGYESSILIWRDGKDIAGVESQVESSFKVQANTGADYAFVANDVSYFAGFTYPVECFCDATSVRTSGCSANLWNNGACPIDTHVAQRVCKNPLNDDQTTTVAHPWFAACAGQAYTFPFDTKELSNGICQTPIFGVMFCRMGRLIVLLGGLFG